MMINYMISTMAKMVRLDLMLIFKQINFKIKYMSRKQIKHLIASNFMGIADKMKKMRKNNRKKK